MSPLISCDNAAINAFVDHFKVQTYRLSLECSQCSSRQLKANNCVTELAVNGAEAVELVVKANDEAFDCILMDCEMVKMAATT